MRYFIFLFVVLLSCNDTDTKTTETTDRDTTKQSGQPTVVDPVDETKPKDTTSDDGNAKVYSNARFRNVTVQKLGDNSYRVKGQGQIFEANFSWVVEDGHEELAKGHQMTDAGAPEWGNFDYTIKVSKKRENSTLHLILFEISAKDGSRQHELLIPLG